MSVVQEKSREFMRAAVFLRAVLPLIEVLAKQRPDIAHLARGLSASVSFDCAGSELTAHLAFGDGTVRVVGHAAENTTLRFCFPDLGAMNAFFAGKRMLTRIRPYLGLTHPILLGRTIQLMTALRILEPNADDTSPLSADERALRVRLLLYLVTRALSELAHQGHDGMRDLAEGSPERVYQWSVEGSDIAAYVRMFNGRVQAGRGIYARRRPFVQFQFASVDAAFDVLTATGSQMTGFRGRRVETYGSPEYTRKVALMMQKVDELMVEG